MNYSFSVHGLKTRLVKSGDNFLEILLQAAEPYGGLLEGDILVIAESALATADGNLVVLNNVHPSKEAVTLGKKYNIDPALVEVILKDSDFIVGGIPGFLLCMKNGTLLPNAGIDGSNAPPGTVVRLPPDPNSSAEKLRTEILEKLGIKTGIIIADSRTHAMRLGCSGVAIGCAGFLAVTDERGKKDLYGHELEVTKCAIADNMASAAELVMGEADECIPAAIIRGLGVKLTEDIGVETIDASECLFMGAAIDANPALFKRE
ncbi:MAG: coenzyme F420-0:L-glutamate ligase [Methanogenium sp.]|nr:coenzyme F420-0:L-glutamate ligase [Methanogenium sp.]